VSRESVFKSARGRDVIRAYYNGILGLFPLARQTVHTSFGETFVLEAGSAVNPPVVLLHGSCSNSAAWLGDLPALAAHARVYAVDLPGEPGNSEDCAASAGRDEYPRWLREVLDALHADKAVVIGNSMGGWLALRFAAAFPERTAALVLLAPSGIVPPRASFLSQTKDFASDPGSAQAANAAVTGDTALPREVLEFMALVAEHFIPFTGALPILSDTQMRKLTMPVLYIAGTADATMDARQAARRLERLVPHAQIRLREGAHIITGAAEQILPFLKRGI